MLNLDVDIIDSDKQMKKEPHGRTCRMKIKLVICPDDGILDLYLYKMTRNGFYQSCGNNEYNKGNFNGQYRLAGWQP